MSSFDIRGENTNVSVATAVTESVEEKLLGVSFDNSLDVKNHIKHTLQKGLAKVVCT